MSRMQVYVALLATGCVSGAIGACGGVDEVPERDGSGCDAARACDIRETDCQEEIFGATACAREQEGATMPPVRIIDVAQLEQELRAKVAGESPMPEQVSTAYGLAGLLQTDKSVEEQQVAHALKSISAYYDTETKSVTIVDRQDLSDPEGDLFVLSHEFAHAIQDESVGLEEFRKRWVSSTDGMVASKCVTEGEATLIGFIVLAGSAGRDADTTDWDDISSRLLGAILKPLPASETLFLDALSGLPYAFGLSYISAAWLAGGQDAIDAIYKEPPTTLLSVATTSAVAPLDCYPTEAPAGLMGFHSDSLGGIGAFALAVKGGIAPESAGGTIGAWRDDSFVVFAPVDPETTSPVAFAWRIRWNTPSDAEQFGVWADAALDATTTKIETVGTDVVISGATDPDLFSGWAPASVCGKKEDLPSGPSASPSNNARASAWLPHAQQRP